MKVRLSYEALREYCLRYANLWPEDKMRCADIVDYIWKKDGGEHLLRGLIGYFAQYADEHSEPLPAPDRWEDVTGECNEVPEQNGERGGVRHCYGPHGDNKNAVATVYQGYRLHKVQLNHLKPGQVIFTDKHGHISFSDLGKIYELVDAFIVERKVG